MFFQSQKFIQAHQGRLDNDAHQDLKADFVIANPPFNASPDSASYTCQVRRSFEIPHIWVVREAKSTHLRKS